MKRPTTTPLGYRHNPSNAAVRAATCAAIAQGAARYSLVPTDSLDRYEIVDNRPEHPDDRVLCTTNRAHGKLILRVLLNSKE